MKQLAALCVVLALLVPARVSAQGAVASVVVVPAVAPVGRVVVATVSVALPSNALGSYSGTLTWDPRLFSYVGAVAGPAGFVGLVGERWVSSGRLVFAAANPYGALGTTKLLTVTLLARRAGWSRLDLSFSAMAEARTFRDLLPGLRVVDGGVAVMPR
jgi:hypothetical protein